MSPQLADAPHFDSGRNAWILSRYADVVAALQEPRLRPPGPTEARDEAGRLQQRLEVQQAFSVVKLAEWQSQMETLADRAVDRLPSGRPVDLIVDYAKPWCLEVAILVTGANPRDRDRLAELSDAAFAAAGEPDNSTVQEHAAEAIAELQSILQPTATPMAEPTFVGVAQTFSRLLGSGWLALLEHPTEWARLRAQPGLIPHAMEELLRHAGIVQSIVRRSTADLDFGGVRIAKGDRVLLMLAAANHDAAQFSEPDRLDVTRQAAGHVALGAGRNSCAGSPLIRTAAGIATAALVAKFAGAELTDGVAWCSGSRFRWPVTVPVILR